MTGSPAHAGIDRIVMEPYTDTDRFPRTRGDRPALGVPALAADWVPPHTRG